MKLWYTFHLVCLGHSWFTLWCPHPSSHSILWLVWAVHFLNYHLETEKSCTDALTNIAWVFLPEACSPWIQNYCGCSSNCAQNGRSDEQLVSKSICAGRLEVVCIVQMSSVSSEALTQTPRHVSVAARKHYLRLTSCLRNLYLHNWTLQLYAILQIQR